MVDPPVDGKLSELPFHQLDPGRFEDLIVDIAEQAEELRLEGVAKFGVPGQPQNGIDVIGFTAGGVPYAFQCKRVRDFSASKLSEAIREFVSEPRPYSDCTRLVIALSGNAKRQVQQKLRQEQGVHRDFDLRLWDAAKLSRLLRYERGIVITYFGKEWADRFCVGGVLPRARRPADGDVCPFPGLLPFGPGDAAWFNGREALTVRVRQRLDRLAQAGGGLQVLTGTSGSGKSSLIGAGVVPDIAEGRLPGSRSWSIVRLTPTDHPADRLKEALSQAGTLDGTRRVAVLVDQFEEVFTLCGDESERGEFIDRLAGLPGALVVICVRSDFLEPCKRYPALEGELPHVIKVEPLSPGELGAAFGETAREAGLDIEPGLTDVMLAEAGMAIAESRHVGEAGAEAPGVPGSIGLMPLFGSVLRAVWLEREGSTLTRQGYRDSGGLRNAIATAADDAYQSLSDEDRQLARKLFLRLVKVGDGESFPDVSRRVLVRELRDDLSAPPEAGGMGDTADVERVLAAFVSARLITQTDTTAALAHEALLGAWPQLREWIDENRPDHLQRQEIEAAADRWSEKPDDKSRLYHGKQLSSAIDWAERHTGDLVPAVQKFLKAASRRRRQARVKGTSAIVIVMLLVLAGGTILFRQHESAIQTADRDAYAKASSEAGRVAATNLPLAEQLRLAAYKIVPTAQGAGDLISAENTPRPVALALSGTDAEGVGAAAYAPGGNLLAVGVDDDIELWQTADPLHPRMLGAIKGDDAPPAEVTSVAFASNGTVLAAADSTAARLWNVSDPAHPRPLGSPLAAGPSPDAVAFSPHDGLLAIGGTVMGNGGSTGRVSLWNASRPEQPEPLGSHLTDPKGGIASVAFSGDGRTLAAGDRLGNVRLWDVSRPGDTRETGQMNVIPRNLPQHPVGALAFSPASDHELATAAGVVELWNVTDPGHPEQDGKPLTGCGDVQTLSYDATGSMLAAGCESGAGNSARLWDVAGLRTTHEPIGRPLALGTGQVHAVAVSPDGRTVFTGLSAGPAWLWSLPPTELPPSNGGADSVTYSPDGSMLAAATANDIVGVWDMTGTARPRMIASVHAGIVPTAPFTTPAAFSRSGGLLAVGGGDGDIWTWDISGRQHERSAGSPLRACSGTVTALASSVSGLLAAGCDGGTVEVWDASIPGRWRQLARMSDNAQSAVNGLAFSPDSRTLAVAGASQSVQLWDVTDSGHPARLGHPLSVTGGLESDVTSVAFSPRGDVLAAGDAAADVRLWNVNHPAHPVPLGKTLSVGPHPSALAFSKDGLILAVGGGSTILDPNGGTGSVQLWNVADTRHPKPMYTLSVSGAAVRSVVFSPSDGDLATASADGVTRLWQLDVGRAVTWICGAGNAISPAQWREYVSRLPYNPPCRPES